MRALCIYKVDSNVIDKYWHLKRATRKGNVYDNMA